jgi:hypothetical protein
MKTTLAIIVILATSVSCVPQAFGLVMELQQPVRHEVYWPVGLADLLNSRAWAHAEYACMVDYYYYAGATSEFNVFLDRFSKIGQSTPGVAQQPGRILPSDTTLKLVLHAGKKTGTSMLKNIPVGPGDPSATAVTWQADWLVKIYYTEPGNPADNTYIPILELWTGGVVKLSEVKVPMGMEVVSDGAPTPEINEFIAAHEAKRKAKP